MRLREARERRSGRERVQWGRFEKDHVELDETAAFACDVKYAFAAAASAAVGSLGFWGEVERRRVTTWRSTGVSSSSSSESSTSEMSPSRSASAAKTLPGTRERSEDERGVFRTGSSKLTG